MSNSKNVISCPNLFPQLQSCVSKGIVNLSNVTSPQNSWLLTKQAHLPLVLCISLKSPPCTQLLGGTKKQKPDLSKQRRVLGFSQFWEGFCAVQTRWSQLSLQSVRTAPFFLVGAAVLPHFSPSYSFKKKLEEIVLSTISCPRVFLKFFFFHTS